MTQTNKHVQFEVTLATAGIGGLFGGTPQAGDDSKTDSNTENDDEYQVLDEEGYNLLSQMLGGG